MNNINYAEYIAEHIREYKEYLEKQGSQGYRGISGPQGISGSSGTVGFSGISGSSGAYTTNTTTFAEFCNSGITYYNELPVLLEDFEIIEPIKTKILKKEEPWNSRSSTHYLYE